MRFCQRVIIVLFPSQVVCACLPQSQANENKAYCHSVSTVYKNNLCLVSGTKFNYQLDELIQTQKIIAFFHIAKTHTQPKKANHTATTLCPHSHNHTTTQQPATTHNALHSPRQRSHPHSPRNQLPPPPQESRVIPEKHHAHHPRAHKHIHAPTQKYPRALQPPPSHQRLSKTGWLARARAESASCAAL